MAFFSSSVWTGPFKVTMPSRTMTLILCAYVESEELLAIECVRPPAGRERSRFQFHFVGFLPHKSGQRRNQLEALKDFAGTLILYESPYRIEKLLGELAGIFPDRRVVLARELTKKFEEYLSGTPGELLEVSKKRRLKGEFVVLIGGHGSPMIKTRSERGFD